ncbi:MAG: hypothetical protein WC291_00230 [Thermodesulfovibrionales bacterium]|jgi:Fe-S cluster assembly scaffold protein SufB
MTKKRRVDSAIGTAASWSHMQTELKSDIMNQITELIGPEAAKATLERMNALEKLQLKLAYLRLHQDEMSVTQYMREMDKLQGEYQLL